MTNSFEKAILKKLSRIEELLLFHIIQEVKEPALKDFVKSLEISEQDIKKAKKTVFDFDIEKFVWKKERFQKNFL